MIRHILLWKLKDEATDDQVAALFAAMKGLQDELPQIRAYSAGPHHNPGLPDPRYRWAVVMDFDSLDDLTAYLKSEAHTRVVRDHVRPLVEQSTYFDYEIQP